MRVMSGAPQAGYSPAGWTTAPQPADRRGREGLAMAVSTFMGLETALRGLSPSSRRSIDTTSHNIANASTAGLLAPGRPSSPAYDVPGVCRSPPAPASSAPASTSPATSASATRSSTSSCRAQTMLQGQAQAHAGRPPAGASWRFNEPSDSGLSSLLSQLLVGLAERREQPRGHGRRARRSSSRRRASRRLQEPLRAAHDDRSRRRRQNVTARSTQVNSIGTQIAQLNLRSRSSRSAGDTPNDLLDQRDLLLDKLSALGNAPSRRRRRRATARSTSRFGGATCVSSNRRDARRPLAETRPHRAHVRQAQAPDHAARHDDPGLPDAAEHDRLDADHADEHAERGSATT